MKLLSTLIVLLASMIPALGSVFPPSTNGNNVFTGTNTFTKPLTSISYKFSQISPPDAPGVGSVTAGGAVDIGTYYYRVSYVTTLGETEFGAQMWPGAVTTSGFQTVNLTNISVSTNSSVIARNIYRGGQSYPYFIYCGTLSNNTATTYSDTASVASRPAVGWQNRDDTFEGQFWRGTNLIGWASVASTAWGYGALVNAIGGLGFDNSAFGVGALGSSTNTVNNTAFGNSSLNALILGGSNQSAGVHSGQVLTNGTGNTFEGEASAMSLQAGNFNTIEGSGSLFSATYANNNSTIGYQSLYNLNGDNGVGIGYQAGYYETSGNSFYLSTRPGTDLASGKSAALMYGTFNDLPYLQTLRINANSILDASVQVPSLLVVKPHLQLMDPTDSYGMKLGVASTGNGWIQEGNNASTYYDLMIQPLGGNVGIGTTTPANKLSVNGDIGAVTITLTNNPTFQTTNVAPTGFILGTTIPKIWFAITNAGNKYLIPGFAP